MTQRVDYAKQAPELFRKLAELGKAVRGGTVERSILNLVSIRASQVNGCAFCLDMHIKEAKLGGEKELRLHHLAGWRESPLFLARERAALAWAEILTRMPESGVPDEVYARVRAEFSEKELSDLTFHVGGINAWNRINVAFRAVPGSADAAFGLDKAQFN